MQFARHQALLRFGYGQAAAAEALTQRLDDHHRAHAALLRQSLPYHLLFSAGLQLTLLAALWFGAHEVLAQRLNVAQWLALMIVLALVGAVASAFSPRSGAASVEERVGATAAGAGVARVAAAGTGRRRAAGRRHRA